MIFKCFFKPYIHLQPTKSRPKSIFGTTQCLQTSLKLGANFADFKHLSAASWAGTLGGGATIFHDDGFGAFHFLFAAAFHAITFHCKASFI